jgi:hypothetical protein
MHRPVAIALGLVLLAVAGAAHAQADFVGVRALGMGEARRAIATGAEGVLLNPSGMSLIRGYTIEAIYGFRVEDLGHTAHVSIVDSITSRVAAGLFYTYIHTNPRLGFNWAGGVVESAQLTRQGHATGLALSLPLGDKIILGAAVKYLHFDTTAPLPEGTVPKELTLDTINGVTFDVALLLRLGERFRATVIGQNLWDHGSRETPLTLGIGLAVFPIPALAITFDTAVNFTGFREYKGLDPMTGAVRTDFKAAARLGPGLEYTIAGKVPIRAGVVYDSGFPATYITAGLGFVSTQVAVDLGYRGKVAGGIENSLALSLRIFIN